MAPRGAREDEGCDDQSAGRSELRQAAEESAARLGFALRHDQDGAAPFSTEADPLQQPKNNEQRRRESADRLVIGQTSDQERRNSGQ
jgi:hypothetical protein